MTYLVNCNNDANDDADCDEDENYKMTRLDHVQTHRRRRK